MVFSSPPRHLRLHGACDVLLNYIMVRGPGDEPRISGKADYDGTLKDWAYAKITLKSYLHQKKKWLVTQKGVAK